MSLFKKIHQTPDSLIIINQHPSGVFSAILIVGLSVVIIFGIHYLGQLLQAIFMQNRNDQLSEMIMEIIVAVVIIFSSIRAMFCRQAYKFVFDKKVSEVRIVSQNLLGHRSYLKYPMDQIVVVKDEDEDEDEAGFSIDIDRLSFVLASGKRTKLLTLSLIPTSGKQIKLFTKNILNDENEEEWNRLVHLIRAIINKR